MIFYCPVCKKLDTNFKMKENTPRVTNMRDGWGYPLYHMKCKCGNYLAAGVGMFFTKDEIEDSPALLNYIKRLITGYNKNGCFYMDGYYEYVKDNIDLRELHKRLEEDD